MQGPRFKLDDEVEDIGSVTRPVGIVVEVLENFGGFGNHHYMVVDNRGNRHMKHETSLEKVK